jgi:hypothetical protein
VDAFDIILKVSRHPEFSLAKDIVILVGLVYGIRILSKIEGSISSLNTHVALLLDRDENKEKRLDNHDERIRNLETQA